MQGLQARMKYGKKKVQKIEISFYIPFAEKVPFFGISQKPQKNMFLMIIHGF